MRANRNAWCTRVLEEGLKIPRLCLLNFDCRRCAFDQWLDCTAIEAVISTGKTAEAESVRPAA